MKTTTGAYLKTDKDHDVLGNLINPQRLYLPEGFIPTVIVEGKKLFWDAGKFQFQCAKCLEVIALMAEKQEGKEDRRFYIVDSCGCNRGTI